MSSSSTENEKNSKPPEPEEPVPPHPDCQESRLVPDESEEYEEQQTGIELSYILTEEEIYECLIYSGRLHGNRRTLVLSVSAPAILAVVFLAAGFATYRDFYYFCAVLCVILAAALGIFPRRKNRVRARAAADGCTTRMIIYPDRIEVDREAGELKILMNGTAEFAQTGNLLVIYAGENILIIPVRCIKPRILPDVKAMIVAGTRPKRTLKL
jgi:hypothetical protein